MKRRTKIVCTLGPATDSKEKIAALIDAGMNVARLNCSHGDWEIKHRWVQWIRELSPREDRVAPVGILADLQGPKFRTADVPSVELGRGVELPTGSTATVGPGRQVPIEQPEILAVMRPGDLLLLGDGEIEIKLLERSGEDGFLGKMISGGVVKSRKGVTVVGRQFNVPALSEKDIADLEESAKAGVDFIALSYVKHAEDVRLLRTHMDRLNYHASIVAKIETREAVKDIDLILPAVDVVMIARGDMGLQMNLADVPKAQKFLLERCSAAGVPAITATQMLESMVVNPRPTRAEASDVYNAILDGTDAVMLSGETAAGAWPIESVKVMARLAEEGEEAFEKARLDRRTLRVLATEPTDAIAQAVATLERQIRAKAVLTTSTSGQTPRLVARHRPRSPILCATWKPETLGFLSVVWGVEAAMIPSPDYGDDTYLHAIEAFTRAKRLKSGDRIVFTAGVPAGIPGRTNLIMVQQVP
ncbi:MAG: pyruvate kinase [Armatimonadota bacterium]